MWHLVIKFLYGKPQAIINVEVSNKTGDPLMELKNPENSVKTSQHHSYYYRVGSCYIKPGPHISRRDTVDVCNSIQQPRQTRPAIVLQTFAKIAGKCLNDVVQIYTWNTLALPVLYIVLPMKGSSCRYAREPTGDRYHRLFGQIGKQRQTEYEAYLQHGR